MQVRLLHSFRLLAVTSQASRDWIGLNEPRGLPGMWIVAGSTVALRSGMLNFRLLDFLRLIGVAGHTNRTNLFLVQDDLAIFRSRVAGGAGAFRERRMRVSLHQFRRT